MATHCRERNRPARPFTKDASHWLLIERLSADNLIITLTECRTKLASTNIAIETIWADARIIFVAGMSLMFTWWFQFAFHHNYVIRR